MQSLVQSTKEKPSDTLFLHIYNGTEKNVFTYYEDAGNGFGYKQNEYCKRAIEFNPSGKKIIITKQEGAFNSNFKKIQLIFHGFDELKNLQVNNSSTLKVNDCNCKLLNELDNLSDIYDPSLYQQLLSESQKTKQQQVVIDNSTSEITIAL
jgi:alpha-glucosidase